MRILHVIDSAGLYGAEIMLLSLMREQCMLGHEPALLSLECAGRPEEGLAAEAERRGMVAERLILGKGFSLKGARSIVSIARAHGAAVVHSHGYKGNILLGSLPRRSRPVPIVSTVHGWTATRTLSRLWVYRLADRWSLGRMDAVVHVSSSARPIRGATNFVIRNGIPALKFECSRSLATDPVVRDFGADAFVIGAISRLSEEKGLGYLVEAIEALATTMPDVKGVVIGEGPQRKNLIDMIRQRGLSERVMLTGYRHEAYNYLPFFKVFVLPSLTEGLPITVLEAMHAGVPVVASRVGGIPELLAGGDAGVLVEPRDARAIASAISALRADPARSQEITQKARRMVQEQFSSRTMAENYLGVYAKVLSAR